jgi:oxygen-dependent protoporphyrinogen oxidase
MIGVVIDYIGNSISCKKDSICQNIWSHEIHSRFGADFYPNHYREKAILNKILIIGAGMTGLCAAWYLRERFSADAVRVLEAGDVPGGTARSAREGDFTCEWGPNGFLDKEPKTLQWLDELGLGTELVRANEAAAHRFVYRNGTLHEVKPPPGFLLSPLMSLRGRLRLLCEPLIKAKRNDEPESIWDFARRRIGREAADILVSPMVSGVYGGDAKQLSLVHCFPIMAEMERTYGGLFKALRAKRKSGSAAMGPRGTLTSLPEGIGRVPEVAASALGDALVTGCAVTGIRKAGAGFSVETSVGETYEAAAVVVAAPAYAAAEFCGAFGRDLVGALKGIPYAGIAVVCTGFAREQVKHDLNGFGFLVPRAEGMRALGCLWDSSIFPKRAPEGHVLLRTMYGGATDPGAVQLSDDELLALWRKEIGPIVGASGEPAHVRIYRWTRGIPQYTLGHGVRLRAIESAEDEYPGLVFAGNAYRGVSLNDCVLSARRAVDMIG